MENISKVKSETKIMQWLTSKHEPVVDLSSMTEREIRSMYRAILK